nr:tetra-peptide repeat homeobox protein 1-like [Procambarus clarkii]
MMKIFLMFLAVTSGIFLISSFENHVYDEGKRFGPIIGSIVGPVNGRVIGSIVGLVNGPVIGSIVGPVNGPIIGSIIGPVNGPVIGSIIGPVNGPIIGSIIGPVNGPVIGSVIGPVNGPIIGSIIGPVNGPVVGSVVSEDGKMAVKMTERFLKIRALLIMGGAVAGFLIISRWLPYHPQDDECNVKDGGSCEISVHSCGINHVT